MRPRSGSFILGPAAALISSCLPTLARKFNHSNRRRNKPRSRRRWALRLVLAGFFAVAVFCLVYAFWASTFDLEDVKHMRERSTVYDIDGKIYSRLAGENRLVVPSTQVSKTFQEALLAREDARFYEHHGFRIERETDGAGNEERQPDALYFWERSRQRP